MDGSSCPWLEDPKTLLVLMTSLMDHATYVVRSGSSKMMGLEYHAFPSVCGLTRPSKQRLDEL
jgi:hypothetical protein